MAEDKDRWVKPATTVDWLAASVDASRDALHFWETGQYALYRENLRRSQEALDLARQFMQHDGSGVGPNSTPPAHQD